MGGAGPGRLSLIAGSASECESEIRVMRREDLQGEASQGRVKPRGDSPSQNTVKDFSGSPEFDHQ